MPVSKRIAVLIMIALFLLVFAQRAAARKNLYGGVALEQEYDSNIDREASDEKEEWTSRVTPNIIFSCLERTRRLSLEYAPSFVYYHEVDEEQVDHLVSATVESDLSHHLQFNLQNTFVRTDEPYSDPDYAVDGIRLSDRRGRNRYWTNNVIARATYEYARESHLGLGYQYQLLENDGSGLSDFARHSPDISAFHRINRQWSLQLNYRFIKGEFDDMPDLTTHSADGYLYYNLTPFSEFFGHYGYSRTKYDELSPDYRFHNLAAGLDHRLSAASDLGMELGISLLQRDGSSDTDTFYTRMSYEKRWARTSWDLAAESGLDEQQFSGTEDQGLSRYWAVHAGVLHTLMQNVVGSVDFSYREDTYPERQDEKEERFESDLLLVFAFARYYQATLGYSYVNQDADAAADQYEDHRIYVSLSAGKDLLRW